MQTYNMHYFLFKIDIVIYQMTLAIKLKPNVIMIIRITIITMYRHDNKQIEKHNMTISKTSAKYRMYVDYV